MILNRDIEEWQEHCDIIENKYKKSEEAYENIIKVLAEKERIIEEITNENASLKI